MDFFLSYYKHKESDCTPKILMNTKEQDLVCLRCKNASFKHLNAEMCVKVFWRRGFFQLHPFT